MEKQKIKRLVAACIDMYLVGVLCLLLNFFSSKIFSYDISINFTYILFMFKDITFRNKSIGKKILNLEIVKTAKEIPFFPVLILRNITSLIWIIEVVLIIIFNKKIGDILFKTQVLEAAKE